MARLYVETYGCQMNVADSDLIMSVMEAAGYERTEEPGGADVILVNTCAVRDRAEQRVIGRVGFLKQFKRPGTVLGVVGCMAQRLGAALLEDSPQVDIVLGPDAYRSLPDLVAQAQAGERRHDTAFRNWEHYEDVAPRAYRGPTAFVTVQRGCDYRCTFCIVPMTRGPERSRKLSDVIAEVDSAVAAGVTEVTLLGQTVNSYHDGEHDFADLLRAVGAVDGIRRVRFTSPHPNDFTTRVIEAMAETPVVCDHVHLPVQSGSNRVLKRMLRRYTREAYLDVVERLRRAMPSVALTTDIIVGFPGETDEDVEETLSLVREVGFDDAYTFRYSPRDGTPATRLKETGDDARAGEHLESLIDLVRQTARQRNIQLVGSTHEVLVEEPARRGGLMLARTRQNKVVLLKVPESWVGRYLDVVLTGTTGSTFTGTIAQRGLAVLG